MTVNALIDVYAAGGGLEKAHKVFDKTHDADAVLWKAMTTVDAQNGFSEMALEIFKKVWASLKSS